MLFAKTHVAVEQDLGAAEGVLARYAKISFETEVQTLPLADARSLMPTRRGLLPTYEWRKVCADAPAYCEQNNIGLIPWRPLAAGDPARPGGKLDVIANATARRRVRLHALGRSSARP